jgi:type IV pilus assembly protein PilO
MWPAYVLVACGAGLFSASATVVWLLWPSSDLDLQRLFSAHQALQGRVQTQQANLGDLKVKAQQLGDPAQALSWAQQDWPTHAQMQPMLMALYRQGQSQGLQWELFRPEAALTSQGFAVQPVSLRLRGSFAQLVAWSHEWFQQTALWVPEKWTLSAHADGGVSLDALVHLYLRTEDDLSLPSGPVAEKSDSLPWAVPWRTGQGVRWDPFSGPVSALKEPQPLEPLGVDVHPLRRWPLQALAMVGSFSSDGSTHALVQTPVGLFRVAAGDRLGIEGGQVVRLDEGRMQVRVLTPQAPGQWAQRLEGLAIGQTLPPERRQRP